MEISKHTHNIVSKWKSEALHSMCTTQDFAWAIAYSSFMPHILQTGFCSVPCGFLFFLFSTSFILQNNLFFEVMSGL